MEPEGSLQYSQEPSTGPYLETDASSPHLPTLRNYLAPLTIINQSKTSFNICLLSLVMGLTKSEQMQGYCSVWLCILRSCVTCKLHQLLLGWDGWDMLHARERWEMHTKFSTEILESRDGRIILEWILGKECRKLWTGFIWQRIVSSGGILLTRQWTLGFHKRRGISWLAE
jgi:hypothetical protein